MSIFENIPVSFPLRVSVAKRPVEFTLKTDNVNRIVAVLLLIFWCVLSSGLIISYTGVFQPWDGLHDTVLQISGAAIAAAVIGYFGRRVWTEIREIRAKLHVLITKDMVEVSTQNSKGAGNFSCPISSYRGIQKENWGTFNIGDKKAPVLALVMRHEDNAKSVPLIITDGGIGEKNTAKIAGHLKLPVLPFEYSTRFDADVPEGTVFANSFQSLKVRGVYWFLVLAGAVMIAAGVYIAFNWGLNPADGGVLKPLPDRLLFGGVMIALALAMVLGMRFYVSRYVVSMQRIGERLFIRTANQITGPGRKFAPGDVESIDYRAGKLNTLRASVNAPWKKMRVKGVKHPFIIDMQAEFIDADELNKLASG